MARVAAVVVAAGQGLRAGSDLPKQFRRIGGQTLLEHALLAFASAPKSRFCTACNSAGRLGARSQP